MYSKTYPFYRSELDPPSENLRRGKVWLEKHNFQYVDYDEMVRQLDMCEAEHKCEGGCGCDSCPSLVWCREMFDSKCPSTTTDEEVLLIHRQWCCGYPMVKDGERVQGERRYRAYKCKHCGRVMVRANEQDATLDRETNLSNV
jgi:hypothetical protein